MRANPRRAALRQRAAPGCALLLFCLACPGGAAAADAVQDPSVSVGGTRNELTVIAEDVSLRDVLEYIAHHQRLSVEAHVSLQEPITIELVEQTLADVLGLLLRKFSFTLQLGNSESYGNRLWIYPRDDEATPALPRPDHFGVACLKSAKR